MLVLRAALLSGVFCATLVAAPSPGRAYDPYPWCAYYGGSDDAATNCYFMAYQQCMDAISGNGGRCDHNPFYLPVPPRAGGRIGRYR